MKYTIPFWSAVLINVNIVVGAGFFLKVQKISTASGSLAPLAWIACGLLLLPLVNALAQLSQKYPRAGGIYIFSKELLGEGWGVVSGWAYYLGTAAANALLLHAFCEMVLKIAVVHQFVTHHGITPAGCDTLIVIIFTLLNLCNIEFLERTQIFFTLLKLAPVVALISAVPLLFSTTNVMDAGMNVGGMVASLPNVFFAFIGIEACCSIMDKIENSKKNASRLIFTSFTIIVVLYALLQTMVLGIHGQHDLDPFMSLPGLLFSNPALINWASNAIHIGLLASFLAGFYGMFYFNNWNLHTMAHELGFKQIRFLTTTNRYQVPWVAVLFQSTLILSFLLLVAQSDYITAMSDVGTAIAYLLSAIAFFAMTRSVAGVLGMLSCGVLLYLLCGGLLQSGLWTTVPFVALIMAAVALWAVLRKAKL